MTKQEFISHATEAIHAHGFDGAVPNFRKMLKHQIFFIELLVDADSFGIKARHP